MSMSLHPTQGLGSFGGELSAVTPPQPLIPPGCCWSIIAACSSAPQEPLCLLAGRTKPEHCEQNQLLVKGINLSY